MMTTKTHSSEAARIVAAAMSRVAEVGLEGLTMRDLARAVGKSTTVIVNQFGTKQGLLEALAQSAYELDAAYHHALVARASRLTLGRDALVALASQYLRERAQASASFVRVWENLLVMSHKGPALRDLMGRWEAMRRQAWRALVAQTSGSSAYGEVVCAYLTLEQFYAGALVGRLDYETIAAEGLGGLFDRACGRPDEPASATESFIDQLVIPRAPADGLDPCSMKFRLLDLAADQMLADGVDAVTNRSVSHAVGTSTSTIAYHWPDMDRFVMDAIWHAVFREMPEFLDHRQPAAGGAPDVQEWGERMARTLALDGPPGTGFYVKYAKLIAQVCLRARRDPAFAELAMILRGPEGGGTYINHAELWPAQFDLTRRAATRFALWIKGVAILAAATGDAPSAARIMDAAALLVRERR